MIKFKYINSLARFVGFVVFTSFSVSLMAGPEGGDVVGGAGDISREGNTTTINQMTDRMAIDWQSYNVNTNERVHYIQPDSSSVSLNRILSNSASHIHGRIDANGQVFLVNPNGVFFGKDSVINAGGILASGLSIDPDDFMNGDFVFSALEGTDGLVINGGLLNAATGGSVSLLGQQIQNDGVISAQLGSVNLAAGREAILTFDEGGLLGVQITESILQDEVGVDAAIINNGEISAEDGQILISASASQDVFTQAVNAGELKQARSVVFDEDGSFTLRAGANVVNTGNILASGESGGDVVVLGENVTSSGNISADSSSSDQAGNIEIHSVDTTELTENSTTSASASGGVGGEIKLLGKNVGLLGNAVVEANGATGGGTVLVGGDKTGSNSLVRNSEFIFLGENSRVSVDGTVNGDGGKLITFASNMARVYGDLTSRGGELGGYGGFVETSGLLGLEMFTTPIVDAVDGGGEWLIDPYDITITAGNYRALVTIDGGGPERTYESGSLLTTIGWTWIENFLDSDGRTLTLQTGGTLGDGNGNGDITISTDLDFDSGSANSTLILNAHNDIVIDNRIITTDSNNTFNLQFFAGNDIQITGTSSISTGGGDFYAESTNFTLGADGSNSASISTVGGDFEIYSSGTVNIYDTVTTSGGDFTAQATTYTQSDTSSIDTGNGNVLIQTTGTSVLGDLTTGTGTLTVSGSTVSDSTTGILTVGGEATLTATAASSNDITLDNDHDFQGNIRIVSGNNVTLNDAGGNGISVGSTDVSTITGTLVVTSDGGITDGGQLVNTTGTSSFTSYGNIVLFDVTTHDFSGGINVDTSGENASDNGNNITLDGANLNIGTLDASGNDSGTTNAGDIVINVSGIFDDDATSTISAQGYNGGTNGDLTISGDATGNTIYLDNTAWTYNTLSMNGNDGDDTFNIYTSFTETIFGDAGDDTFAVQNPDLVLTVDGGAETSGDALRSWDGDPDQDAGLQRIAYWTVTGAGVSIDDTDPTSGELITLTNIETLQGGDEVERSPSTGTYVGGVDVFDIQTAFSGTINGGSAADIFNIDNDVTTINGEDGADTFYLDTNTINATIINGGEEGPDVSTDTIYGFDDAAASNAWVISGLEAGTVESDGNGNVVTFNEMESIFGSDQDGDTFTLSSEFSGAIDARGGSDTVNVTQAGEYTIGFSGTFNGIQNIDAINNTLGDSTGFTLTLSADANDTDADRNEWTITTSSNTANTGSVVEYDGVTALTTVTFSNFASINGNALSDIFDVSGTGSLNAIDGGEGADTFNLLSAISLSVSGGEEGTDTSNDILNSPDLIAFWSSTADEAGTIVDDEDTPTWSITFSEFENIQGGTNDDTFTLSHSFNQVSGGEGVDTFSVTAGIDLTLSGGEEGIDTSNDILNGPDLLAFWNSSADEAGTVVDDEDMPNWTITFSEFETLQGNDQSDTFTLGHSFGQVSGGEGADTFNVSVGIDLTLSGGEEGADTSNDILNSPDVIAFWNSSADEAGTIVDDESTPSWTITFSEFENLQGGTNNDTFTLGHSFNQVLGGEGVDTFNVTAGIDLTLSGGEEGTDTSNDVLNAPDLIAFWNSAADEAGTVVDDESTPNWSITFSEFENIQGGTNDDTFTLSHSFNQVSGGEGVDTFSVTAGIDLTLSGGEEGIDTSNDILNGPDLLAFWNSSADEAGTIVDDEDMPNWTITFSEFETLQGNDQSDTFTLGHSFGQVSGGEGADTFNVSVGIDLTLSGGEEGIDTSNDILNGPDLLAFWNSSADEAGTIVDDESTPTWTITFDEFETLQGGTGVDTYTVAHGFTQLLSGAGNDTFNLYTGAVISDGNGLTNDVLGGGGDDTFNVVGSLTVTIDGEGQSTADGDLIQLEDTTGSPSWVLADANSGTLNTNIEFTGLESINGADASVNDQFEFGFSEFFGGVDGNVDARGGDSDSILITDNSSATEVTLGASLAGVANAETIASNNSVDGLTYTLELVSEPGAAVETNTWLITDINDGSIDNDDDPVINFTDFANVLGNEANDVFVVSGSGSIESVNGIRSDGTLGGSESNSLTYFDGNNRGDGWELTGANAGTINTTDLVFSNIQTITGSGNDNLTARDQANTWVIDTVSYVENTGTPTDTINFSGMDTLNGNANFDNFTFNTDFSGVVNGAGNLDQFTLNTTVSGTLNGGGGDDTFSIADTGASTGVINGDGGDDTIIGQSGGNTWSISEANGGSATGVVADFNSIETLDTADGDDTINYTATESSLNRIIGGDGDDTLNISGSGAATTVTVDNSGVLTSGQHRTTDVENIYANNAVANTLVLESATSDDYRWDITDFDGIASTADGINDGQLHLLDTDDNPVNTINFVNFETLQGGDGDDSFVIDTDVDATPDLWGITNTIDGGAGTDEIFGRDGATAWVVNESGGDAVGTFVNGISGNTSYLNIEALRGGDAADSFAVNNVNVAIILDGGDATDTVTLPVGQDVDITIGEDLGSLSFVNIETIESLGSGVSSVTFASTDVPNRYVEWNITGDGEGTVGYVVGGAPQATTTFINFQSLFGGAEDDTFVFDIAGTVQSISGVEDSLSIQGGEDNTIIGRVAGSQFTVNANLQGLVADSSAVPYLDDFTFINALEGSATNVDTFTITSSGEFNGTLDGGGTGGDGITDTLTVQSVASNTNEWEIDGAITDTDSHTVRRSLDAVDEETTFTNIESLMGGSGTDWFTFLTTDNTVFEGTINAAGGSADVMNVAALLDSGGIYRAVYSGTQVLLNEDAAGTLYAVSNVEQVTGNNESNLTFVSSSGTNNWDIEDFDGGSSGTNAADGANDGQINNSFSFVDFANLEGNAQDDTFIIDPSSTFSGNIDAIGTSGNALTWLDGGNTWQLDDATAFAGSVDMTNFSNIQTVEGNNDTFIGREQNNTWRITDGDGGTVVNTDAGGDQITFIGMANIQGNIQTDNFTIADGGSISGMITGTSTSWTDNNNDSLLFESNTSDAVTWTLGAADTGVVEGNVFQRIEILQGGNGDDTFDVSNSASTADVRGNSGSDTLTLSHLIESEWTLNSDDGGTVTTSAATVTFDFIEAIEGNDAIDTVQVDADFSGDVSLFGGNDDVTLDANIGGVFNTGDGADDIYIVAAGLTTTINGGGGDGENDTIEITHMSASEWTIDGTSNTVDDVGFSNIETIIGNDEIDTVTLILMSSFNDIQTSGGNDVVNLFGDVTSLNTGDGDDTININEDEISVDLNGGGTGDNDILNIAHSNASSWLFATTNSVDNVTFSNVETLQGNDAVDTVDVNTEFMGSLSTFGEDDVITLNANFTSLNLGDGSDEVDITVDDLTAIIDGGNDAGIDVLTITHVGASNWTLNTSSTVDSVTFSQFETVNGNGAVDTVTVNGDFGSINTNGGLDVVNLNADVDTLNTGADDDTIYINTSEITAVINAGNGTDELIGPTRAPGEQNDWSITSDNAGTLNTNVEFTNVENISGNDGDDVFTFANNASVTNVRGIAAVLGVDSGSNTLSIDDAGITTWTISGDGEGTVNAGANNFYDIENLIGGEDVDQFNFTTSSAAITGYIDGGESGGGEPIDVLTFDTAAIAAGEGLVVELMTETDQVTSGIPIDPDVVDGVSSFAAYDNVQVLNIESINAPNSTGPDAGETEARNWLVLNHGDDVQWDFSGPINSGSVVRIEDDQANPVVAIANSLINFQNFGSMQAGAGDALSIPNEGSDISGVYILGSGRFSRNFENIVGLVVVDIDPRLSGITGNGNTLLRVVETADGGDPNFNVENDWLIDGSNSGSYTATWGGGVDDTYSLTFSGVNQLQGGIGDDTFVFSGVGDLVDGSIHGGSEGVDGVNASASTIDMNFAMTEIMATTTAVVESFPSGITSATLVVNNSGVIDLYEVGTLLGSSSANITTLRSGNATENYRWDIDSTTAVLTDVGTGEALTFLDAANANTGNIDQIIGGAADDIFNVSELAIFDDNYNGGAGNDVLNLTSIGSAVNVSFDDDAGGKVEVWVQGIEDLNLGSFENYLFGGDGGATWTIDGINGGTVVYSDDAFVGTQTTTIDNVSHIVAGDANDDFIFDTAGIINGTIDAGAGTDTLDASTSSQALIVQISATNNDVVDTGTAVVDLFAFEDVTANSAFTNELRANSNAANAWLINGTDAGSLNGMTFDAFANLSGSTSADTFTLDGNDSITGVIDGGTGLGVNDQLILTSLIGDAVVAVSDTASAGVITINNIEQVDGLATSDNRLVANDEVNSWTINTSDGGQLQGASFENVLTYSGFANLQGGILRDNFVFTASGVVSGVIDGNDPSVGTATQIDTVDLSALANDITISLNAAVDGDVDLLNVEEILANTANSNSLYANDIDNNWLIDAEDAGQLSNSNIAFDGFANLFGGSGNDVFSFEALGDITGVVDGGAEPVGGADQVDMSQLAVVRVVIGDTTSGFVDIESYRGNNNDSVLTAANLSNTWTLSSGVNDGQIVDQLGDTILFEDFNELEGGNQNDNFNLNGGSVSGEIRGGLGNDDLIVTVVDGVSGQVSFDGGDGTDTVSTSGGNIEYTATYTADASGSASLEYNFQDTNNLVTYSVDYDDVESVTDNVLASLLTVNDLASNADTIILDTAQFTLNALEQVTYDNKSSLSVLAENGDTVSIEGPVVLANTVEFSNGAIVANAADAEIQALQVNFSGNQTIGAAGTPIELNVDGVAIESAQGNVYLNEANNINITSMSNNSGDISLVAGGDITDGAALSGSSVLDFTSLNGSIILDENNSFTNTLHLSAANDIELTNTSTSLLGDITAQNFTVVAGGNVTDQGTINISANASFTMNSNNLLLNTATNDFTNVSVSAANNVDLVDVDDVSVQGNALGDFNVNAEGAISAIAGVTSEDILLQSNNGAISINGNLTADNSVTLIGEGVDVFAEVRVSDTSLGNAVEINSGAGALVLAGGIDTSNANAVAGDVVLQGNSFDQQIGANISAGDVDIVSATFINQASDITAEGNVTSTAQNGDLFMASGTVTQGYEVELSSVGAITIETIIAEIFTVNGVNVLQNGDVNASGDVSYTVDTSLQMAQTSSLSSNGGNIDLSASSLDLEGAVNATSGAITTSSISDTQIGGALDAQSIEVMSGSTVAMDSVASIIADSSVSLNAEGDIAVSNVQATDADGQITVVSNSGGLQDNNGGSVNFVAYSLDIDTETNIGTSSDAVDTQIEQLSALNNGSGTSGSVNFSNDGELSVFLLRSNTDINISNVGTLTMVNSSGPEFEYNQSDIDARTAGGVINANYNSGTVNIDVSNGDLLASNPPRVNRNRPEIVGEFVNVSVDGNFGGTNGRPIVVYVQEQMSISRASGGIFPIWGFNEPPNSPLITDADLVDSSAVANVSELLIDVESVDEIDPAVFTEVRNYSYDNISIRMPRDQLYEDDEEEAEEDEFAL